MCMYGRVFQYQRVKPGVCKREREKREAWQKGTSEEKGRWNEREAVSRAGKEREKEREMRLSVCD